MKGAHILVLSGGGHGDVARLASENHIRAIDTREDNGLRLVIGKVDVGAVGQVGARDSMVGVGSEASGAELA